jgi:transcriptional regulator with XRE-family HTH domain
MADPTPTWTVRSGEDLGRAIAGIRASRGLTQRQFADQIGISREYLAKIESGRSVSLLEHILRAVRRSGASMTIQLGPTDGAKRAT